MLSLVLKASVGSSLVKVIIRTALEHSKEKILPLLSLTLRYFSLVVACGDQSVEKGRDITRLLHLSLSAVKRWTLL